MISVQPIKSKEQMEGESEKSAFISGLKDDLDFALFSQRMKTVYCISSMFPLFRCDGTFTGKVYVVFDTIQERDAAVSYLNGTTYGGAPIQAEKFTKEYTTSQQRNCFVKFIPLAWTQARLTEYCSRFGDVESCIIRDAEEGAEFTTGFVCFVTNQASTLVCSLTREDAQNPEKLAFAPVPVGDGAEEAETAGTREGGAGAGAGMRGGSCAAAARTGREEHGGVGAAAAGGIRRDRGRAPVLGTRRRQALVVGGEGRVGGSYVTFAEEPSASNALRFLRGQRFQKQGIYSLLAESKDRLAKKKTKEAAKKTKAIQMNAEPKELELDLTHMVAQKEGHDG